MQQPQRNIWPRMLISTRLQADLTDSDGKHLVNNTRKVPVSALSLSQEQDHITLR